MQLKTVDYTFVLLTPCFSGTALGKHDDHAEMRVPPVRGHIRFWHRVLFGASDANRVWGSTEGAEGCGSRVALRFLDAVSSKLAYPKPEVLPHKENPNHRGPRAALAANERFTLQLQRLVGCSNENWDHAQRAVKTWLLLGGLGLRSNRAAGSVWPLQPWAPSDANTLKTILISLGLKTWSVALVGLGAGKSELELREAASDTIAGSPNLQVFGGIRPQREPSPTKFKVINLSVGCCLLACAPQREIHCEDFQRRPILREAEHLLTAKPNPARWKALGAWNYICL